MSNVLSKKLILLSKNFWILSYFKQYLIIFFLNDLKIEINGFDLFKLKKAPYVDFLIDIKNWR
jgi:hypothetical protein